MIIPYGFIEEAKLCMVIDRHWCANCGNECGLNLIVSYRFFHIFFMGHLHNQLFYLSCEKCYCQFEIDQEKAKSMLYENPIPLLQRRGLVLFCYYFPVIFFIACGIAWFTA